MILNRSHRRQCLVKILVTCISSGQVTMCRSSLMLSVSGAFLSPCFVFSSFHCYVYKFNDLSFCSCLFFMLRGHLPRVCRTHLPRVTFSSISHGNFALLVNLASSPILSSRGVRQALRRASVSSACTAGFPSSPLSRLSGITLLRCLMRSFLKTIVSRILSQLLVVSCEKVDPVLVTLS